MNKKNIKTSKQKTNDCHTKLIQKSNVIFQKKNKPKQKQLEIELQLQKKEAKTEKQMTIGITENNDGGKLFYNIK